MNQQTSASNPIRFDVIETSRWPGQLSLTLAPGKKGVSLEGYMHRRSMFQDFEQLKLLPADVVVNLMEGPEEVKWFMQGYDDVAAQVGMNVRRYPIPDVSIPSDLVSFRALVEEIYNELQAEKTVVVHCLGGKGRSGTLAACLLIRAGMGAEEAIDLTRRCRKGAIEGGQPEFVREYAEKPTL